MLPLQLILRPEQDERSCLSPPRFRARKRRSSLSSFTTRASRRRSRGTALHKRTWKSIDGVTSNILALCSAVVEAVVSTTTAFVHTIYDTVSVMLQKWWGESKEADSLALEVVEHQRVDHQNTHGILEENKRLKRMLEAAMTSHLIVNGATSMLDERAEHWMKRTVDAVDAKVLQAEQQRDALTLEFKDLQDKLGDKDQEIERLRDGFVWATENLNTKEDEICELQERLDRYEALLKVLDGAKVV